MGLDMYLDGIIKRYQVHDYNIGYIKTSVEIGYWRKANAIHKWFVDNIQGGVDNCATYYLDKTDLLKLKETCEQVLKDMSLAEKLLPTQEGFFFGNTEYDEDYIYDLKETIKICEWALNKEYDWFEYNSSW